MELEASAKYGNLQLDNVMPEMDITTYVQDSKKIR